MRVTEQSRSIEFQRSIDQVVQAFEETEGDMTTTLHRKIMAYTSDRFSDSEPVTDIPEELVAYLDKVTLHAYKITDADIKELQVAGYSDDAIFELTVGGSLGAGLATWQAGIQGIDAFFEAEQGNQNAA